MMTLRNMRQNGVRSLAITCHAMGCSETTTSVSAATSAAPLKSITRHMPAFSKST